jgi:acylphosphatase
MENKMVHVFIQGRVQGVYFRQNTQKIAEKQNVKGWIRNLSDGRVEAVFEGNVSDVDKVIEWCRKGPVGAKVDDIKITEENYYNEYDEFKIISDL